MPDDSNTRPPLLEYRPEIERGGVSTWGEEAYLWGPGGTLIGVGFCLWVIGFQVASRVVLLFMVGLLLIGVGLAILVVWAVRGHRRR